MCLEKSTLSRPTAQTLGGEREGLENPSDAPESNHQQNREMLTEAYEQCLRTEGRTRRVGGVEAEPAYGPCIKRGRVKSRGTEHLKQASNSTVRC
jgi:hypothetical protein